MPVVISQLSVDCDEPAWLARWWAEVLGWRVHDADDPDEVWIEPLSGPHQEILFLRVPDRKTVKNRIHLDVRPADGSDQATELARLLALGARPVDIGQGDVPWHVLADPEGNEFCLLLSTPSQVTAILAARAASPTPPQLPD